MKCSYCKKLLLQKDPSFGNICSECSDNQFLTLLQAIRDWAEEQGVVQESEVMWEKSYQ